MRLLVLDAETFYDSKAKYSLRSMPNNAYIRDEKFHEHGWAVKEPGERARWLDGQQFREWAETQDFSDTAIIGHNLLFDGSILAWHHKIKPALWIDTLGMSRAVIGPVLKSFSLDSVGQHLGVGGKLDGGFALRAVDGVRNPTPEQMASLTLYAVEDAELTWRIYRKLAEKFPQGEYEILDWTIRCYTEPSVLINQRAVDEAAAEEAERREKLIESTGLTLKDLRSDATFAGILKDLGIEPPKKISKRTGKEAYAFAKTDEEMVALLEDDNPYVRAIVEARLGVKTSIVQTRLASMKAHAATNRGRFSVGVGFSGAHTHRFSAVAGSKKGGLNILNFPRKGKMNATLEAPKGWVMCNADSSQIEARMAMWQADEAGILGAFRDKKDPYCIFAGEIYHRQITKANEGERFVGKVGMLSLQYGASHIAFQNMVRIQGRSMGLDKSMWTLDEDFCRRVVQTYRRTYNGVPKVWKQLDTALAYMAEGEAPPDQFMKGVELTSTGYVLPSGLEVNYHDLSCSQDGKKKQFSYLRQSKQFNSDRQRIYGAMMLENICQSLAREAIVADQLVTINRELRVVWQVYDSIVCLIPEDHVDEYCQWITDIMSQTPVWAQGYGVELPIACEVGVGKTYADAKKQTWKPGMWAEKMRAAA